MTRLTIGLPVYNGAATLARSLDNLLAQTFGDFVLIISDNGSTDATPEICAEYARRDPRVRYVRQQTNLVWNENFRFLLNQADTPYFMWVTHDDIWLPRFAEANIAQLEANPGAVCSVSQIIYFRPEGERALAPDTGPLTGTPSSRLGTFLKLIESCGRLYGVYRTEALKQSFPAGLSLFASDWLVVALTLLYGDHLRVDEVLLEREAQPTFHYLKGMGRIDRFTPSWRDRILPLRAFNAELRRRVPPAVWRDIRPALAYLNLRVESSVIEYEAPWIAGAIRPVRKLAANLLHKRWRVEAKT